MTPSSNTLTNRGFDPSTAGRSNANIIALNSVALSKAVVSELLMQQDSTLSPDLKEALELADPKSMEATLDRMVMWVDISGLMMQALHHQERLWRSAALSYCVRRQAHYPLLVQLFKATRAEVKAVRQDLGLSTGDTRPKLLPSDDLLRVYAHWKRIDTEYSREADKWVAVAQAFPEYGLNSLYLSIKGQGRECL